MGSSRRSGRDATRSLTAPARGSQGPAFRFSLVAGERVARLKERFCKWGDTCFRLLRRVWADHPPAELKIEHGRMAVLKERHGYLLCCRNGEAWVTQEGDPKDHLITPGERVQIAKRRRVVIEARGEYCVVMLRFL